MKINDFDSDSNFPCFGTPLPWFFYHTLGHPDAEEPALEPPRLQHLHCPRLSRPPRHRGGQYTLALENPLAMTNMGKTIGYRKP